MEVPVAGGTPDSVALDGPVEALHGLTGTDEAGSGGDD
jgi:hypothetical protein